MPAIHRFKFKGKVLNFEDSDIIDALENHQVDVDSRLSHKDFLDAAFEAALASSDAYGMSDDDWLEMNELTVVQAEPFFEFAMSSLVQEVYGL